MTIYKKGQKDIKCIALEAKKINDFVLITRNHEVLAAYEKIKSNETYPNFTEETKQLRKENFIQY